jgi:beta-xylosidase
MTVLRNDRATGTWHDTSLPPLDRARALLSEMTLIEKVQQLGSTWPGAEDAGGNVAPMQETFKDAQPFSEAIVNGLGHLTRAYGTAPLEPTAARRRLNGLQAEVVAANRFGIPAIAHEECLTGVTAWKATIYPTSLAWAATWNPSLIAEMGSAIGHDLARAGVHQGLAPVLDVVRDYRWGRVEETMGEDPYLVSELATGYVQGIQSAGVVATVKHFAGYSASRGARNHAPASVGRRELMDVILPPFEKAIVVGGVGSVMNSYADVDGVPPASDTWLLTELLREQWDFAGTVVSDYWAVPFLHTTHRVAADLQHAASLALAAGLDVELPHTLGYGSLLVDLVDQGRVSPELVDRAVLRVLTQKAELGLLDEDWRPDDGEDGVPLDLDHQANRVIARQVAEESIVLLANNGLLPLTAAPPRIAVIGPASDDPACLFGCYSFPNHVVVKHPGTEIGVHAPTVLDAVRAEFPDAAVEHEVGCDINSHDRSGLDRAVLLAARANLTVVVVGDRSGMFGVGTSGEGCDAATLDLPGVQAELARRVLEVADNVVLVVVSGRPYAVGELADQAAASIQAFFPGQEGAGAVAGVLSGRVSPSGRLPVQIPGSSASQPGTYLGPVLAQPSDGVSNLDPTPAFAFGHGLGYTSFEITSLEAGAVEVPTHGVAMLRAAVRNSGTASGTMVPQLYLTDPVASVTRPVKQLVGFTRVELAAGETAELLLTVPADLASFTGTSLRRIVEPGELVLTLAQSAADAGRSVVISLVGETRQVDHTRALSSDIQLVGPAIT